jgi:AcrR family transcriptional regulator
MKRSAKEPDVRKDEFVATARRLFERKGYEATSVDDIADAMGVAKGLFYYYFDSKDEILDLITNGLVEEIRETVEEIASKDGLSAMQRIELLMAASSDIKIRSAELVRYFHMPRNRLMHLEIEQRSHEFLVPAFETIIRQGVKEGVFSTKHPRETALAYLGAASAVGHDSAGHMTDDELLRRVKAFQSITERLLGSKPGSFTVYDRLAKQQVDKLRKTKRKSRR